MLKIEDTEHFARVMEFALNNGCADKFIARLDYLARYGDGDNICHLHYDWAPNSFSVVMNDKDGKQMWVGGLIYSGPEQPLNGSAPALTVGIGIDTSKHGWSLHT